MSIFTGKTALIIEDDLQSIRVLEHLLEQLSVGTNVIQDSSVVVQELGEALIPDVIFLDLEMPSSNGYSVLQYIQRDNRFMGVPVIAYTTHISHLNDVKNAGFDGFLGKPVDGRKFPQHLERILTGKSVWEVPE